MHRFESELVPGRRVPGNRAPYDTWTFVVVPDEVLSDLGQAGPPVRGTIAGLAFRGTVHRSDGVPRVVVKRELLDQLGADRGDVVEVRLELDPESREADVPPELAAVLDAEPDVAERYANGPPSLRRAWATHVAEAKRPETRSRRAARAIEGLRKGLYPGQ